MAARLHLAPLPGAPLAADSTITVVLADDHVTARRNVRLLLDREDGLNVIAEAESLPAVLRHVADHHPQVLVLDVRLSNGSSLGTIHGLREQAPETQIVVLTMEDSPAFVERALDAGAVGLVTKDHAEAELPAAVRRAAKGEEYVSPRLAAKLDALRATVNGDRLSPRETEVLRRIALGYTSAEIAHQLNLSRRTVETHRARIHHKLGLATRAQLVSYALGRHLIGC